MQRTDQLCVAHRLQSYVYNVVDIGGNDGNLARSLRNGNLKTKRSTDQIKKCALPLLSVHFARGERKRKRKKAGQNPRWSCNLVEKNLNVERCCEEIKKKSNEKKSASSYRTHDTLYNLYLYRKHTDTNTHTHTHCIIRVCAACTSASCTSEAGKPGKARQQGACTR